VADNSGAKEVLCIRVLGDPAPLRQHRRRLRSDRQGRHPGRRGQKGRCRALRRRAHQEREAPPGRLLHPLRRERGRPHQRGQQPRARASSARSGASFATRSSCASSHSHRRCCDEDQEGRQGHRALGKYRGHRSEVIRPCLPRTARARGRQRGKAQPEATRATMQAASSTSSCRPASAVSCGAARTPGRRVRELLDKDGRRSGSASNVEQSCDHHRSGNAPALKERYLNVLRPSSKRSSAWPTSCRSRVSRRSCSTAASAGPPAAVPHRGRPARPRADHRPKDGGDEAKQSIAGFKLREGQAIGVKVTLRGDAPGSSSTGWSLSPSRGSVTSGALARSFDGHGTTPSASPSS